LLHHLVSNIRSAGPGLPEAWRIRLTLACPQANPPPT
jgi:hypothetical protein